MAKDLISYFEDNKMGNIVEIDYEKTFRDRGSGFAIGVL